MRITYWIEWQTKRGHWVRVSVPYHERRNAEAARKTYPVPTRIAEELANA